MCIDLCFCGNGNPFTIPLNSRCIIPEYLPESNFSIQRPRETITSQLGLSAKSSSNCITAWMLKGISPSPRIILTWEFVPVSRLYIRIFEMLMNENNTVYVLHPSLSRSSNRSLQNIVAHRTLTFAFVPETYFSSCYSCDRSVRLIACIRMCTSVRQSNA